MGGWEATPQPQEVRSVWPGQFPSPGVFLSSLAAHELYALGGLDTTLQLSSWGHGARGGFRRGCSLFPLSGAAVTLAPPGTPGDLAVCSPVSWGFPQALPCLACRPQGGLR